MLKTNLLILLKFLIVWIGFALVTGQFEHFKELPRGVHQSAQCDRASLAQNYYYGGLQLLYPEVNENRCIDGIVSCELPLTAYLSAILYKIFGYDEFWFRLLSYLFFSSGMFALFLLLKSRINEYVSLILILMMQASPILMFYAANFLPDISALGLSFIALFIFIRKFLPHPFLPPLRGSKWDIIFVVSMSLAIASKTTSAIHFVSMLSVVALSYIRQLDLPIINRKKALLNLVLCLIIPTLWFFWSRHLSMTHNSQYFMMRIPWSETYESYRTSWLIYLANWPQQTFSEPLIYIFFGLFFIPVFLKKHIQNGLWYLAILNFIGSLAFLFLMIEQFKYHDYYIICLFPSFALNWLILGDALSKLKSKFWWIKIAILACIIWAFSIQYNGGNVNLRERYTEGNYWDQSHVKSERYDSLRLKLNDLGIDRNTCVASGYDPAPNNILYLLHLRGHRISKEHDSARMSHIIFGAKPSILISNDTALDSRIRNMTEKLEILTSQSDIKVFRIHHSKNTSAKK